MWALIDCNSFFCSVERVFHLGLKNKPVVVQSNNDGCIVALTPESKKLGLHRGDPIFKVRSIVDANHVAVFSTNMTLYAAMSRRVTNIMRKSVLHVENYSIDESFCDLQGYEKHYGLTGYMHSVTDKIQLYTDIPVSVGIAPSKTIAKMGSKFAKNYKGYKGVCAIDTDEKRRKALELFPLDDVEKIGCMPTLVEKRTLIYERLYNVAAQIKRMYLSSLLTLQILHLTATLLIVILTAAPLLLPPRLPLVSHLKVRPKPARKAAMPVPLLTILTALRAARSVIPLR
jgi:umuC protein